MRRGGECVRGRSAGGFRLGAVAAVRSPGEGGGAGTAVGGDEELREAFDAAAGEGGLLGLDGFRVSLSKLGLPVCLSYLDVLN